MEDFKDFVYVREVLPVKFAVVTVGAAPHTNQVRQLRCLVCGGWYQLSAEPVGLEIETAGLDGMAVVKRGYVEMCQHCWHEHTPGSELPLRLVRRRAGR